MLQASQPILQKQPRRVCLVHVGAHQDDFQSSPGQHGSGKVMLISGTNLTCQRKARHIKNSSTKYIQNTNAQSTTVFQKSALIFNYEGLNT